MGVKKPKIGEKPQILEGFTYEELPSDGTVEIPQEIIDNSVVIDINELQNEEEEKVLEEAEVQPVKKIEEVKPVKKNTVEFELPHIKEPNEKTILQQIEERRKKSNRRNKSRKVTIEEYVVNLDDIELPDTILIDHKAYASLIKKFLFKGFLLKLMAVLRDNDELSNEAMTELLKSTIPNIMREIVDAILVTHKMIAEINGSSQIAFEKEKDSDDGAIQIALNTTIKFPNHVKSYESTDIITIPA